VRQAAESTGIETAAEDAGYDVVDTQGFSEGRAIPGIANSLMASRFAFEHDTGAVSEVYENDDQIYFFEVGEKIPAGYSPLEDVRAMVVSGLQRERRAELAKQRLAEAVSGVEADTDLAGLAKLHGLSHAVTDTFGIRDNIENVGFASAFARAAMDMKAGQFCREVQTPSGVYAFRLLYHSEFDEADFRAQRMALAANLHYGRRQGVLQQWMARTLEEADVEDLRGNF
jgi:parvulin-like peptidyl-prolyl isomerase